jgi:hypothetical protein
VMHSVGWTRWDCPLPKPPKPRRPPADNALLDARVHDARHLRRPEGVGDHDLGKASYMATARTKMSYMTFIPALNTIWGIGSVFEYQGNLENARIMYSKALVGYEKVVASHDLRLKKLRDRLRALDSVTDSEVLKALE